MSQSSSTEVVVVGAGVIGLMTALELADAGVSVLILDQQRAGRESSWAGGGILAPLHPWQHPQALHHLHQQSLQLYPVWIDRLISETAIDPQYYACGMTILQQGEAAQQLRSWMQQSSWVHVWQDTILHLPEHANIGNPQLLKGLQQLVRQHKRIVLQEYARVVDVTPFSVVTEQCTYPCQAIVIAAGAWSGDLAQSLGFNLDVFPVKGQMLLYDVPRQPLAQMHMCNDHYLIPRKNGQVVVGSTLENVGFNTLPSAQAFSDLQRAAESLYPPLAQTPILAHWAGLRPGSTQLLPLIGPHPILPHIWMNTGHYRNGLCLAPASAKLLAQQLLGERVEGMQEFQLNLSFPG